MAKRSAVYILANFRNGVIYIGATNHLVQRIYRHREGILAGISRRYRIKRLVWYEYQPNMAVAERRRQQLKNWKRQWQRSLIDNSNPSWSDRAAEFGFEPLEW